jgi:hypothetical protein
VAVVLDDAETVDPKVLYVKPAANFDSILECPRKVAQQDSSLTMFRNVILIRPNYVLT